MTRKVLVPRKEGPALPVRGRMSPPEPGFPFGKVTPEEIPGPHAMTAQAGAVAFAWYLRTGHGDSIHFGTEPPECLLSHKWKPLYATPPAAVPVEALEGLVKAGKKFRAAQFAPHDYERSDAYSDLAAELDRIERLIKERSK